MKVGGLTLCAHDLTVCGIIIKCLFTVWPIVTKVPLCFGCASKVLGCLEPPMAIRCLLVNLYSKRLLTINHCVDTSGGKGRLLLTDTGKISEACTWVLEKSKFTCTKWQVCTWFRNTLLVKIRESLCNQHKYLFKTNWLETYKPWLLFNIFIYVRRCTERIQYIQLL